MSEPLSMIRVWGEFKCFARPKARVERVSYPADPARHTRCIGSSVLETRIFVAG